MFGSRMRRCGGAVAVASSRRNRHAAAGSHRYAFGTLALMVIALTTSDQLTACPFCLGSQQLTLRERMDTPDVAVLVEWASGERGNLPAEVPATTTFEVIEVFRGDFTAGEPLVIDRYQDGRPADSFLLSGNRLEDIIKWDRAIPLSDVGLSYVRTLPEATASSEQRLGYALRHLESTDDMVATDAFSVVAAARYEELFALRDKLPRKQLRRWVFGKQPIKGQRGVYGMLLGLCGDATDRQRLEELILNISGPDDWRLGIGGVMGGYLLLADANGLDLIDREFLINAGCSTSDRTAAMQALRFIWEYGEGRIDKARLRQSVREHLKVTDMPDLAIADLARWQDWSVVYDLIAKYQDPVRSDKHVDKAIVKFMIVAAQTNGESSTVEDAKAIAAARRFVEQLQQKQPGVYKRAARTLIPR